VSDTVYLVLTYLRVMLSKKKVDDVLRYVLLSSNDATIRRAVKLFFGQQANEEQDKKRASMRDITVEAEVVNIKYVNKGNVAYVIDLDTDDGIIPFFVWDGYEDKVPSDLREGDVVRIENVSTRKSKKKDIPFIFSCGRKTEIRILRKTQRNNSSNDYGFLFGDYIYKEDMKTPTGKAVLDFIEKNDDDLPEKQEFMVMIADLVLGIAPFVFLDMYYPDKKIGITRLRTRILIVIKYLNSISEEKIFPEVPEGAITLIDFGIKIKDFYFMAKEYFGVEPTKTDFVNAGELQDPETRLAYALSRIRKNLERKPEDIFLNGLLSYFQREDAELSDQTKKELRKRIIELLEKTKSPAEFILEAEKIIRSQP